MVKLICKFYLLLIVPGALFSGTISAISMAKLSPDLQALVAEKSPENAHLTDNRFPRVQTVAGPQREILYPVTIRSTDIHQVKAAGLLTNSDHVGWSTARVSYDQLIQLTEIGVVTDIFQGDMLYPLNDLAVGLSGADLVQDAYLNNVAYDGTGVIVLIIDTGIDWSHKDFRGPGSDSLSSRILYIWDQTLTKTGLEGTPQDRDGTNFAGLNYGVEYTQAHIEDEIDGSPTSFVREKDTNGHGTAMAGAAVGNGASLSNGKYTGMAPGAEIVVVKTDFTDNNVKEALSYAEKISATEGKPVVVNLSLGNQSNAHDGTSTLDEAVDDFVASGNGRVAVVAAGNEGNDLIHVTGTVAKNATATVTITVPSFSNTTGASNDYFSFELWWNNNDNISATVTSPNSKIYTRTADETGTDSTTDGTIQLYNITDSDHSNGDRRTFFQVYDGSDGVGPAIGDWMLDVTNNSASTMTYHAWLYASSMGATVTGGDTTYTIASPAVASSALTIGSFSSRWHYTDSDGNARTGGTPDLSDDISYFSSIGPTRNGSQKPDLCAPGLGVITTTSTDCTPSSGSEIIADKYHLIQGTSASAGVVSGAVALMLDYNSSLSAATVKSRLTGNADADSYTNPIPNSEWGYGKLNIFESLAMTINNSASVDHDIYFYDTWSSTATVSLGAGLKTSVRFSPSNPGDVTGAFFHPGSDVGTSNSISFEIWSDYSGTPNAKLGSTVTMAVSDIAKNSWNYLALKAAGVSVSAGTDYHLVFLNTASASFKMNVDNGASDSRSHFNTGSSWTAYGSDWRMRPVVSTDESTLDSSLPVELAFFNATPEKGQIQLRWATESETENLGFSVSRRIGHTTEWILLADYTSHPELQGQGSTTARTDYQFTDHSAKLGVKYDYRLMDISYSATAKSTATVLEDVQLSIDDFKVYANYPNPFNPSTRIAYQIAQPGEVQIRITDIQGREIRSWTRTALEPGYYENRWDGFDSAGKAVGAGIYFVSVQSGREIQSQKMLLIK